MFASNMEGRQDTSVGATVVKITIYGHPLYPQHLGSECGGSPKRCVQRAVGPRGETHCLEGEKARGGSCVDYNRVPIC